MTFLQKYIPACLALAVIGISAQASSQNAGAFLKIDAAQSPVRYHPPFNATAVYLRQIRENSTVYVARWLDQSDDSHTANQIFIESVFSETNPGFAFRTDTPPASLLDMFDELRGKSRANGNSFAYQTPSGLIQVLPFAKDNAQCISYAGRWDPLRTDQKGSQLLGYFCEPIAVQNAPQHQAPAQQMTSNAARDFAADFFLRFEINLPDNTGATVPVAPAPQLTAPGTNPPLQTEGNVPVTTQEGAPLSASPSTSPPAATQKAPAIAPDQGIGITTNWGNQTGYGVLKFDKPAGEGTMIVDSGDRHCEGYWQHQGGRYQSATLPFGNWAIFCSDGISARGTYNSPDPSQVKGEGQDSNGAPVFFRQAGQ
ncbi:hypothetical protein [Thalassospira sp. TSL5-1]|uniref:hypothetical protein n=1 Tax=Thalassospira sp. TSL5-1 TaxID=1544451 RepID=UPI00095A0BE9|nr:hypothetical protein [Thalassospira sp. TSL5-1]OKH87010.1 hypothetical protein LF95_18610 [Thalassospira sp. TSL5-1]